MKELILLLKLYICIAIWVYSLSNWTKIFCYRFFC